MSAASAPVSPPPLSEAARVINTFVAPSSTFADIRRNQSWWVPWVLSSLAALAFVFVMGQKIGFEQIMRNEIAKKPAQMEQLEKLSPEDRARRMEIGAKITSYFSYATPLLQLVGGLIIAAVFLAIFNFGMGAEIGYKQSLAVTMYSYLPFLLSTLLAIVSLTVGVDPEGFNIRNPVATNPAYFMNPLEHKFLYGILSAVDVFSLWVVVLLGIGYSSVSKVKRSTAIVTVLAVFLIYKIVGAAIAAM
ncbi:MAG: YIP1 family protein [Terriglobales bacterium]